MDDKVVLIPLTEEEIEKLPFPETARRLGGILAIKSNVDPKLAIKLKEEWEATRKNDAD